MIKTSFGELNFQIGFKTQITISLFNNTFSVILNAMAYYEKDGVTDQQLEAIRALSKNLENTMHNAETQLTNYVGLQAAQRFTPRTLLVQRDGETALLCDDINDEDNGIAIILSPEKRITTQDEYL